MLGQAHRRGRRCTWHGTYGPSGRSTAVRALAALAVATSVACGGGGDTGGAAADTPPGGAPAANAPAATTPAARAGPLTEAQITRQMVALGDSVFKGQAAGGICFTCHGQNAEGSALAPNLTDAEWINTDGSLSGIENIVRQGVPQPKQFTSPMPGFGGVLNDQAIRAVTAYVYSRTHPDVAGGA